MPDAPILLSAFTMATVSHLNYGLWRHPDDQTHRYTDISYWVELAQFLEKSGFDCVFIADALGMIDVYGGSADASLRHGVQSPLIDPLLLVSAMAAATDRLGFGVTLSTTYEFPYIAARKFSTLDHLTHGRIGWNIVTSQQESAARNLGLDQQIPHDERYARAEEFMEVVYKLWQNSWEDDAVVRRTGPDGESVYTVPEKVHPIRHEGRYFRVPDGHVSAPSPQRVPLLLQAGASSSGSDFAARHAEVIFVVGAGARGVRDNVRRIRAKAEGFGRDPRSLKFLTAVAIVTGENDEEALDKLREYQRYYDPTASIVHYASMTGVDWAATASDAVLHYRTTQASQSVLKQFDPEVSGRTWTLSEAANPKDGFGRATTFVGGPKTVADALEAWLADTETDGINLIQLINPASYADFARYVMPELRARGRLRASDATTLRARIFPEHGSSRPRSDHPAARHAR